MDLSCERCHRIFKYRYLLERHNNKKKQCVELHPELQQIKQSLNETNKKIDKITEVAEQMKEILQINDNRCKFCRKLFERKDNLNRHIKRCKKKDDNILIYEEELGIIANEEHLHCRYCKKSYTKQSNFSRHQSNGCKAKERYESLLEKQVLQNRLKAAETRGQTINNITNNTVNINLPPLRAFGDENLDYITTSFLLEELTKCKSIRDMSQVVGNFTKLIHANPAHPENHNVQLRSLNGGFARVFNGTSFEDRQALDIQDEILQRVGSLITDKCDSITYDTPYSNQIENVREVISEDIIEEIDQGTSRSLTTYRAKVKSVLHSNRKTIESTQKLIDSTISPQIHGVLLLDNTNYDE